MKHERVASLADIERIEQIPLQERMEAFTTLDILRQAARRGPERAAIRFLPRGRADDEPQTVSYAELLENVYRTANFFHDLGIGATDVVSYLLPNLPETHYVIWGGQAAGIVNAVNPLLQPRQIADILTDAGSKVLVTLDESLSPELWGLAQAVRKLSPGLEHIVVIGGRDRPEEGVLSYEGSLGRYDGTQLTSGRRIAPEDIAAYFHTGGTTGTPKLAMQTHMGEAYEAWAIAMLAGLDERDEILLGLPLFHVNAVIISGLAAFLAGSGTVLLSPQGFRGPDVLPHFWRVVEKYRATLFSAVPTIYAALLNIETGGADVSSLRFAICGAAPMPVETFRAFEARTGIRILEGYGLTEGTCASSLNPPDGERRIGSIGIRFPYQDMKTVRLDEQGQEAGDCADEEVGVIAIKGPNVISGYRQARHNQGLFTRDGWLLTGDLARRDEDGYFWLTGRAKDLIIRGGHNIDPGMIEDCLHAHPAVALAAAVGRPDAYAGEIPVAYVQLRPGAVADEAELTRFARANTPEKGAAPEQVRIIDEMPVTAVGKIFKPRLRRMAAEAHFRPLLCGALGRDADIRARADERHGTVIVIDAGDQGDGPDAAMREKIAAVMAPYAFRWEIAGQGGD